MWRKAKLKSGGYGAINIAGRTERAHVVSFVVHGGRLPEDYGAGKVELLHLCHRQACVNPKHLKVGTHKENMHMSRDVIQRESRKGAEHPKAKLTNRQVRQIRAWRKKASLRYVGQLYGIDHKTVHGIWSGKYWRHLS